MQALGYAGTGLCRHGRNCVVHELQELQELGYVGTELCRLGLCRYSVKQALSCACFGLFLCYIITYLLITLIGKVSMCLWTTGKLLSHFVSYGGPKILR